MNKYKLRGLLGEGEQSLMDETTKKRKASESVTKESLLPVHSFATCLHHLGENAYWNALLFKLPDVKSRILSENFIELDSYSQTTLIDVMLIQPLTGKEDHVSTHLMNPKVRQNFSLIIRDIMTESVSSFEMTEHILMLDVLFYTGLIKPMNEVMRSLIKIQKHLTFKDVEEELMAVTPDVRNRFFTNYILSNEIEYTEKEVFILDFLDMFDLDDELVTWEPENTFHPTIDLTIIHVLHQCGLDVHFQFPVKPFIIMKESSVDTNFQKYMLFINNMVRRHGLQYVQNMFGQDNADSTLKVAVRFIPTIAIELFLSSIRNWQFSYLLTYDTTNSRRFNTPEEWKSLIRYFRHLRLDCLPEIKVANEVTRLSVKGVVNISYDLGKYFCKLQILEIDNEYENFDIECITSLPKTLERIYICNDQAIRNGVKRVISDSGLAIMEYIESESKYGKKAEVIVMKK